MEPQRVSILRQWTPKDASEACSTLVSAVE